MLVQCGMFHRSGRVIHSFPLTYLRAVALVADRLIYCFTATVTMHYPLLCISAYPRLSLFEVGNCSALH